MAIGGTAKRGRRVARPSRVAALAYGLLSSLRLAPRSKAIAAWRETRRRAAQAAAAAAAAASSAYAPVVARESRRHRVPWQRRVSAEQREMMLVWAQAKGYTADMAWRWLLGNRRDTAQRMQLEQAGFSFKFRSRLFSVPVTLWVGTTDHGRGLMVDQALVPKGTTVATATGTIVERKTPPPKLRNGRPSYSLKVPGKVESSKPRYIVLDPPTLEHPGNLVNSVLSKEKTEERSANVSFRYCPEKQLVVFTATRALARGDELLADYSGCPAMRRQMKKSQEEAAADAAQAAAEEAEQRAAKLAAAGRDSGGRFTSRNGVGRACPKCGYAKAQMATPLGWNRHVNLCPGG